MQAPDIDNALFVKVLRIAIHADVVVFFLQCVWL